MIELSVSGLVKEFEVGHKILDGLSFQIDSGERVGLLGPNGCGKTTLLRILTGVMDYDEGEVVIAPGRRMGLISQIPVYPAGYTVEDVLDTGVTLSNLVPMLKMRHPNSVRICAILDKPARRKTDIRADYTGFEVPDAFVVGYGLDYDEKYRNLPFVGVLKPEVYGGE